jgi:DNA-binding CsgD family transcriptional regulator
VATFLLGLRQLVLKFGRAEALLLFGVAAPAAAGILALLMSGTLNYQLEFILLVFSDLGFLALLWVMAVSLGQIQRDGAVGEFSATLPFLFMMVLSAMFGICITLSDLVPSAVAMVLSRLLLLTCLLLLVLCGVQQLLRSSNERTVSLASIKKDSVARISADFRLSNKETEVLGLLVTGLSAAAVGRQLFLSPETIKTHRSHIYRKTGIHTNTELVELYERYANQLSEQ